MVLCTSRAHAGDDMPTLRDNIVRQLTAKDPATTVSEWVAKVKPDGSFVDLDYKPDPLTNQPFKHVGRLNDMAVAWGCPKSRTYQDNALKSAILKTYNFWVEHDIQHRNWWFNEIGVPDSLSETMLILQKYDSLPADNFRKAITIIDRALPRQKSLSAANLVWTAYATRNEGVLRSFDPAATDSDKSAASALVQQSFDRIGSTIKFTNSDGINVDYSFHAHGPVPYNGGYGQAWLNDTARIAASAAGTRYGIASDRLKLMIDYVLNGDQFMVRGLNYDLAVIGRDWSRANHFGTALILRSAIRHLLEVEPNYRESEVKRFEKRMDEAGVSGAANSTDTAVGNRAYYTADYMAQQRGDYLLSIKTVSQRTNMPEAMNGENRKGGQAFDGLNLLYCSGNEYTDIEPLWDWYRLPGTTSLRAAGGIGGTYNIKPPSNKRGTKTVAGGASDGKVGAQAYQLNEFGVTANKSWFLFDRGEVAMGNSITEVSPDANDQVVGTNINQTLLNGNVVYSNGVGQSSTLGAEQSITPKGLRWVNHDQVGYFFLKPMNNVTIRNVSRTGAWTDINLGGYSADRFTKRLFDLDLDHGHAPAGGSYVYAVVPGLRVRDMESFLTANPFTVLKNDAVAQAVTDNCDRATEANFYTASDVQLRPGVKLTLLDQEKPISVLLRLEKQSLTMSVASPTHQAGDVKLCLNGHFTGEAAVWNSADKSTTMTFTLPSGPTAGSTVSKTFAVVQ